MSKQSFRIHGFLRTTTPLHISSGVEGYFDPATGFTSTSKGDAAMAIPCNLVQQMTFAAPGTEYGTASVPVIMANNIMGRLRRRAAGHVFDVLKAKGEQILPTTYTALMCGAATGNPDSEDPKFDEFRASHDHAYLGLFGGGPKMYRRYVHCMNAVPATSISRIAFEKMKHPFFDDAIHAIPPKIERSLTRTVIVNRNDDLRELVDLSVASKVIGDFETKVRERQSSIVAGKDREAGDTTRLSTRSFTGLQYVIPNVVFPLCFEMNVTPAQLGLFLLSLETFAKREELGGYGRNGFGRFIISDVVQTNLDDGLLSEGWFSNGELNRDHADVQVALHAWEAEASQFTGNNLNDLFGQSATPEEPAKAPSKSKKTVKA